ncbi:MAG: gluconate 2-dehydrogenase subunit 3 family protein [Saprospiraceae bacterium]|nr:gluconate 2-dehydrogenase subunit 3 family protein [Saprospiraceae bacterium]
MNRRQAIQQLSIMGVGLALYPACNLEDVPTYARVLLERKQYGIFKQFTEAILPVDHTLYPTPEPRSTFILTILNDCTSTQEIGQYLEGLKEFETYLSENKLKSLDKLSNEKLDEIFSHIEDSKESNENLSRFARITKSLAVQHFTGSEKFMTEEMEYEFVPGRYIGCAKI